MAAKKTTTKRKGSALARATAEAEVFGQREPKFDEGDVLVCTVDALEMPEPKPGSNEVLVVKFTVCETGDKRANVFPISNKAMGITARRLKEMCMAMCNAESAAEYDEAYPHGEFLDGLLGLEDEVSAEQIEESQSYLGNARIVVTCTRGSDDDKGSYYRDLAFSRVAE